MIMLLGKQFFFDKSRLGQSQLDGVKMDRAKYWAILEENFLS